MNIHGALFALLLTGSLTLGAGTPTVRNRLLASAGVEGDSFGQYLDFNANRVIVSARHSNSPGKYLPNDSSAYLFDAESGGHIARLLAEDTSEDILFAIDVAVQSGKVFVGAPQDLFNGIVGGSVYVFDSNTGDSLGKWSPKVDPAYESFGHYMDTNEHTLVVSVPGADGLIGALYLFDIATGVENARVTPPAGAISLLGFL